KLPLRAGAYATGSSAPDAAEVAWLSRFAVVHAGGLEDPLPPATVRALRAAGVTTLLAYDWLPAAYHYTDGSPDPPWAAWLYAQRAWASLNPQGPYPHCRAEGYTWCQDLYYDLGDPRVRAHRVAWLREWAQQHGYDGFFFDWGNDRFLDEPAYAALRATYAARHPDLPYARAVAAFYRALRAAGLVVQSNQGFRAAEVLLPVVDLDMTESYATTDGPCPQPVRVPGQGPTAVPCTVYYPLSDDPAHGRLADTLAYLDLLRQQVDRYAGPHFRGLVYLNYAAPAWEPVDASVPAEARVYRPTRPRAAIYYGYALAALAAFPAYTEVPWDHRLERDPVYFYDLGVPVDATYRAVPGRGYARFYTRGVVLVGEWATATTVTLAHPSVPAGPVYDAYRDAWLTAQAGVLTVTVRPETDPLTGQVIPTGRVYVYARP
ncbi:MAG: hypothetical protein GXO37_05880, partial [Chloroflexi bacterium]|nr:hypothetical protein [Chloroflexota bacterium]